MDTPATLRKRPASSLLNTKARQSTASVGSISPPRAWPSPPTNNGFMPGREEIVASHVQAPLRFVLRLRLQKGGVFAGHYSSSKLNQTPPL